MEDWLRFSVVYWHTFRGTGLDPFGAETLKRPWEDGTDSVENAKRRLRAAFEFMSKLGVKYWTYHDRFDARKTPPLLKFQTTTFNTVNSCSDIAPEGATLAETNAILDGVSDLAQELMQKTGIKLLWATCNLFSHPRFVTLKPLKHVLEQTSFRFMLQLHERSLHQPGRSRRGVRSCCS